MKNVITRFPPELSWNIHIGHIFNIFKNIEISKIWNGKLNLRIDDTNNIKNKKKYIKKIKIGIKHIIKIYEKSLNKNILYANKYFYKIFQYLELIIKKKVIRNIINLNNIKNIRKIREGFFKKKKKIIKILKSQKAFRVIYNKHFIVNWNWFISPTYDFSQNISDTIENISHSVCSEEFKKNKPIYNIIKNIIFKKKKPKQLEIKKIKIKNNLLSKSKLKKLVKNILIKNSKDRRLMTIRKYNLKEILKIKNCFFKKSKKIKKEYLIKIKIKNFKNLKIKKTKINNIITKYIFIKKTLIYKKNNKIKNYKKNILLKNTKYLIYIYKLKNNIIECKIYNKEEKKKYKTIKWINNYNINFYLIKIFKNILNSKKKINNKSEILIIKKSKKEKFYKKIKKNKKILKSTLYDLNV